MLTSVSTLFAIVRFYMSEGKMRAGIESPQPLVLSFFGEDTEHDGTIIFLLGCGLVQFLWMCL